MHRILELVTWALINWVPWVSMAFTWPDSEEQRWQPFVELARGTGSEGHMTQCP